MSRGPRNLVVSFQTPTLTHFGGVYLLHRFFTRIGLKNAIATELRINQRNNQYSVSEMILALTYPIILGLERIETTHLLARNGVFQYLTGLPAYPNATTLRRFLLRIAPTTLPKLRRLHDRFLRRMAEHGRQSRCIFDLDSTVLVLYGKQEMARVGYNPTKRGRPSYHPLFCFEGSSRDFWHGQLRPGDVHTSHGAIDLLECCFAKIPPNTRSVTIRADKGFYDHKIIEWVEKRRARFVIVAKLTRPIKRKLAHLRYQKHRGGVETAEFSYQPQRWVRPYRFVVIRRPQPEEPSEQLTLFKLGKYHYQVLVTNLGLKPLNLWRFYNDRAQVELIIRELKGNYPLGQIPTKHFFANEVYFHLLLFAYNLVNWFKRLCLPPELQKMTLGTLRSRFLLAPAQLVRTCNRPTLKLPNNFLYQDAWNYALKRVHSLNL